MNRKKKILVIDDDQRIGLTIKYILSIHGYDVCTVDSGAKGIEKIFEYIPDLILCDVKMAPIDGYKVLRILKQNSTNLKIPFVFLSGYSSITDVRFAMDLGADDYISKPFDNNALLLSIENQLKKYEDLLCVGNKWFRSLFEMSPNYIFTFDGNNLIEANSSFIKFFRINPEYVTSHHIEEILEPSSFEKIKDRIRRCKMGIVKRFNECVKISRSENSNDDMELYISRIEKDAGHSHLLGLLIPRSSPSQKFDHDKLLKDVLASLRDENVLVTSRLTQKLTSVFENVTYERENLDNHFFTNREIDVLQLSITGLSIKQIAEKLQISDRTVERHRAQLMEKTNSNTMIEVIVFAIKNDLIKF